MAKQQGEAAYRNRLLSMLNADDLTALQGDLEPLVLQPRKTLEHRDRAVERVYFPESGMVSVVGRSATTPDLDVEIGIVGYEGMTGLPGILGNDRSPSQSIVQIAGEANSIPAVKLRNLVEKRQTLQKTFLKYAHAFMIQTMHTAIANARGTLEQRMARWLLMAQDRAKATTLPLTHEFLALMLAVRRPGVTEAVNEFTRKGLIAHERGAVVIIDRRGLMEIAGGLYGTPEAEYERLFG
jgi:CRP-like cAMP-binding protein